jgi:hypothetical protein
MIVATEVVHDPLLKRISDQSDEPNRRLHACQ